MKISKRTILSDPDWRAWLGEDNGDIVTTEGVLDYQGEESMLVLYTKPIPVNKLKPLTFNDRVKVTLEKIDEKTEQG